MKATRSFRSVWLRDDLNVCGMMFAAKPGAMNLFGSTIEVITYWSRGSPAFWALAARLSRLGPTDPVVPAAVNVWQLPHPADPVKMVFPFAALPLPPVPPPVVPPPVVPGPLGAVVVALPG